MRQLSITPSITVTIGRHTRLYFAYVTTAPLELDAPTTMTLHAAPLVDVAALAAEQLTFDQARAHMPARVVLVEATKLAWQGAQYHGNHELFVRACPVLVRFNTRHDGCGAVCSWVVA